MNSIDKINLFEISRSVYIMQLLHILSLLIVGL